MSTRLEIGARGPLDGQTWCVLARVTFSAPTGELWDDYLLAHGATRRWLTFEPDRGHAYLWRKVVVPGLVPPDRLRKGSTVMVERLAFEIDECGEKAVGAIDGTPEGVEHGEGARYVEGHAQGFRVCIEAWGEEAPQAHVGVPLKLDATDRWTKRPYRPPRAPQRVVEATEMSPAASFLIASFFVGFVIMIEGCWHEPECRYYREDGTSYTERCSHYDSNSVRVESTGRRLSGFGK